MFTQRRHNLYSVIENVDLSANRIDVSWVLPSRKVTYSKYDYHVSVRKPARKLKLQLMRSLAPVFTPTINSKYIYGTLYCFNNPKTFLYCIQSVKGEVWYGSINTTRGENWVWLPDFSMGENIL